MLGGIVGSIDQRWRWSSVPMTTEMNNGVLWAAEQSRAEGFYRGIAAHMVDIDQRADLTGRTGQLNSQYISKSFLIRLVEFWTLLEVPISPPFLL